MEAEVVAEEVVAEEVVAEVAAEEVAAEEVAAGEEKSFLTFQDLKEFSELLKVL